MRSITDPAQVDHPILQELARRAAWVAKLEGAVEALDDLVIDLGDDRPEGACPAPDSPDEDPLSFALSVLQSVYEEADRELEADAIAWLAENPEHWPIFRLVVLDPWQEEPGRWRAGAPCWVRVLATDTVLGHFQQDPYGRRRELDL